MVLLENCLTVSNTLKSLKQHKKLLEQQIFKIKYTMEVVRQVSKKYDVYLIIDIDKIFNCLNKILFIVVINETLWKDKQTDVKKEID